MSVQTGQRSTAYEVLGPWADVDPVPVRGISPRLKDLHGKRIGFFSNAKRAAHLVLDAAERELLEKFPTVRITRYASSRINSPEVLTEGKSRFEAWVGGTDAVVFAVGD